MLFYLFQIFTLKLKYNVLLCPQHITNYTPNGKHLACVFTSPACSLQHLILYNWIHTAIEAATHVRKKTKNKKKLCHTSFIPKKNIQTCIIISESEMTQCNPTSSQWNTQALTFLSQRHPSGMFCTTNVTLAGHIHQDILVKLAFFIARGNTQETKVAVGFLFQMRREKKTMYYYSCKHQQ